MTHDFTEDDLSLNGTFIPLESIPLSPEHVAWAIQLSQSVTSEIQWQTYLNALALAGVEQWLQKRTPELVLKSKWLAGREDNFSLNKPRQQLVMKKPTDATFSESICQIQVNEFKLYLIATDSLYDTQISLSKTAIESSEFIPQFYVLVEILEELEQIHIRGYLQRDWLCHRLKDDGLIHQQQSISLQLESDSAYFLPLEWFEQDSDKLLLALRCLEPTAIPVTSQEPTLRSSPLTSSVQEFTQRAINVGLWLRDELDQLAQDLSWILLPPLSFSSEYRSLKLPSEQFNDVVAELMNRGDMAIPSQARAVYRDLQWENIALRLYVVTWELLTTGYIPEWTLLLILGTQPNTTLPFGIKLQVRDETQVLEEPVLSDRSQDYLYVQVIGTQSERFWVTISLPDGAALTLPPFTYHRN
jgi:hypothetical protein